MPDWLNPIFVLKTRHYFVFLRKYGPVLLGVYLLAFYFSRQYFAIHANDSSGSYESWDTFIYLEYACVGLLGAMSAVIQMDLLPKRYMDQDLIHYTALTDKQVLFGYIYVGTLYSGLICVCGSLVHLVILPGLGKNGWISFAYFFSFFLISQMLCLFCASFFAGVRKRSEFIGMGFTMYVTVFMLFGCLLLHLESSGSFGKTRRDIWEYFILHIPAVAGCAYGLIHWNIQRKIPLPIKIARTFIVYAILAGGLYLARHLLDYIGR